MLLMAHRAGFRIEEVPVRYRRRTGASKLHPVADGLRHCRLLFRLGRRGQSRNAQHEIPIVVVKRRYRESRSSEPALPTDPVPFRNDQIADSGRDPLAGETFLESSPPSNSASA